MQINKLSQINFGMPKISDDTRALLPKNLSEEDRRKLKYVEEIYPEAQLDAYPVYSGGNKPKGAISKAFRHVEKAIGLNPNFRITIHEYVSKTPDNKPIAGCSMNGDISVEDRAGCMYMHSTTTSYNENLSPDDLVEAAKVYDKRYKKTMQVASRMARNKK